MIIKTLHMNNADEHPRTADTIRIKSSVVPKDRPDFHTWCREFRVSMLHNRVDHWLDFDLDRTNLRNEIVKSPSSGDYK